MANNAISTQQNLPAAWSDAEVMDGLELVDKASLVGKPFLITAIQFTETVRQSDDAIISYVYVDAVDKDDNPFSFNDSSSGVRSQLVEFARSKGWADIVETHEVKPVRLVAPNGLRVSEYDQEVNDPRTGRPTVRRARTFYLTTSGKRVQPVESAKPVRKAAPPKTA